MSTAEPPPSYEAAAGAPRASSSGGRSGADAGGDRRRHGNHQSVIPPEDRRSMEDASRPLPKGWVRQWDPHSHHNFFVDTTADPPRSIWEHPLDDEQYLRSNPDEARALDAESRAAATSGAGGRRSSMMDAQTQAALHDESTDEDDHHPIERSSGSGGGGGGGGASATSTPKKAQDSPKGLKKLGRNVKDKLTNSSHEERAEARRKKREAEERAYKMHQEIRQRLLLAAQTGQPQLVGKDRNGRDVFAQPPPQGRGMAMYGAPPATLGYTPYQTENPYSMYGPGSYARPMGPYGRRPGYGYGGGMGLPIMGGLAGGMLMGGLLF